MKNQGKHLKSENGWRKADNDISYFQVFFLCTTCKRSSTTFFFRRPRLTRKHALRLHIFECFVFTKYILDKIVTPKIRLATPEVFKNFSSAKLN